MPGGNEHIDAKTRRVGMRLSQYAQLGLTCILRRLAYDVCIACDGSNIKRVGIKTGSKVDARA
ncbi:hypothetical protein AX768_04805 [Burkholderia sp. PAMC 28687]|nr:hypothetical protein AX768_04805 [Burkholderia sp. PAMC 28687]